VQCFSPHPPILVSHGSVDDNYARSKRFRVRDWVPVVSDRDSMADVIVGIDADHTLGIGSQGVVGLGIGYRIEYVCGLVPVVSDKRLADVNVL
jgi:hypothetical protein